MDNTIDADVSNDSREPDAPTVSRCARVCALFISRFLKALHDDQAASYTVAARYCSPLFARYGGRTFKTAD